MENNQAQLPTDQELKLQTSEQMPEQTLAPKKSKKKLWLVVAIIIALLVGAAAYWFGFRDKNKQDSGSDQAGNAQITSFAGCKAAGYPIQESYPEKCVTPDGQTFTNPDQKVEETPEDAAAITCEDGEMAFQDADFGAAFCYPSEWGDASVADAKFEVADTGHRQLISFSDNDYFVVGGVSDDWTTMLGRDGTCKDPSNNVPELSSYNTEWHDFVGEGMAIEYAMRSLETSAGGYDMTEEVTSLLGNGVCASGHKVINGSRYRVVSASYYREFSESSGILSPKAHTDNPDIMFTTEQRTQFDRLLASVAAY
ncbi:hypothetical protein KC959_00500 [Candidatus Saccharibacteria bacterium]|nr:hypothetical protein [Candidatus Saccharibacteria bacterium]